MLFHVIQLFSLFFSTNLPTTLSLSNLSISVIKYVFSQRRRLRPHLRIPWIHRGWTPAVMTPQRHCTASWGGSWAPQLRLEHADCFQAALPSSRLPRFQAHVLSDLRFPNSWAPSPACRAPLQGTRAGSGAVSWLSLLRTVELFPWPLPWSPGPAPLP